MRAIIATGGKQYCVQTGDVIDIELIEGEAGAKVAFSEVLAVGEGSEIKVGNPNVSGASVEGEVVERFRGKKLIAFKYKRRKGYRRKVGHRQNLVKVKISAINA